MYGVTGERHHRYKVPHTGEARKKISEKHHNVSGSNNPNAKKFKLIAPSGKVFYTDGNLEQICKSLDLQVSTFYIIMYKGRNIVTRGPAKGYSIFYE